MAEVPQIVVSFDIGIKNLAVAVLVVPRGAAGTLDAGLPIWRILPLMDAARKTKPKQEDMSAALFVHLDSLVDELQAAGHPIVHDVLIENQPSRLNGAMKTVQTWIQAYFALRKHWMSEVERIHLVSAAQKILGHDRAASDPGVAALTRPTTGAAYAYNKNMGVALARYYIAGDAALEADFAANGAKRDDLADAAMQAVAWLRKQGSDVHRLVRLKGT